MSKFALLVARAGAYAAEVKRDVVEEAFEALRTLGHSDADARKLLDGVLKTKRKFADVEAVLQAIYQQSHGRERRPELTRCSGHDLDRRVVPLALHVAVEHAPRLGAAGPAWPGSRRGWWAADVCRRPAALPSASAAFDIRHVLHAALGQHVVLSCMCLRQSLVLLERRSASRDLPCVGSSFRAARKQCFAFVGLFLGGIDERQVVIGVGLGARLAEVLPGLPRGGPGGRSPGPGCCDTADWPARAASP